MRRLVLIACVAGLAGCGQTASTSATFEGEEQAVADVVAELEAAGERRDAERICGEILAPELVSELEEADVSCSEELERSLKEADDSSLEVTDVEVSGTTATATVTGREGDADRVATFGLTKEAGAWRIESLQQR